MADSVQCKRCGNTAPGLERVPYPGELGRQIREGVCATCWAEWEAMEVMVINELRLNFMDPQSMEVLAQHMRDFFFLPPPGGPSDSGSPSAGS